MEFFVFTVAAAVLWKPAYIMIEWALSKTVLDHDPEEQKQRLKEWWAALKVVVLPREQGEP